jgi:hypothetical protein
MNSTSIKQALSAGSVTEFLRSNLEADARFSFLESLRTTALASYSGERSVPNIVLSLKDAQSRAMQAQFEILDGALIKLLRKEGRESVYLNYKRNDDPDLPDDPASLSDPVVAYRYAMKRLYRRQFDVTFDEQKAGGWPLLTFDLLDPLDGTRTLLIQQLPAAVDQHSSPEFLNTMSLAQLRATKITLLTVQAELARRLEEESKNSLKLQRRADVVAMGKVGAVIKIIRKLIDWAGDLLVIRETVEVAKEAWEKAERERQEAEKARQEQEYKEAWDRLGGEPREIRGASDHVDSFERNGDRIGRTC